MPKNARRLEIELPRLTLALISAVIGLVATVVLFAVFDAQTASVAATIATSIAVIVALGVGLVPWFIAQEDRKTRSIVIASRIAYGLQKALNSATTIRDGLGHAAETANAWRIQEAAKRCLPMAPETIDASFEKIGSLPIEDAQVVCTGAMAVIAQYEGLYVVANADLKEGLEAIRVGMVAENNGIIAADLDARAAAYLGKYMMQIGRQAAARAMDTQARVPRAIEVLRKHGAVMPTHYGELVESPVPEVAAAVKAGTWPSNTQMTMPPGQVSGTQAGTG